MPLNLLRKKGLQLTIFAVLFLPFPLLSAQEELFHAPSAPLCGEQTVAAVRINPAQLNVPALTGRTAAFILESARDIFPDPDAANTASLALPMMLAGYTAPLSSFLTEVQNAGLGDIYIIMESGGTFIAIPTGEKTAESLQAVREKLRGLTAVGLNIRGSFVRHGFLIAPLAKNGVSDVAFREKVRARFAVLDTEPDGRFDAVFASVPEAAAVFAFYNSSRLQKEWDSAFTDIAESVSGGEDSRPQEFVSLLTNVFRLIQTRSSRAAAVLNADATVLNIVTEADSAAEFAQLWDKNLYQLSQFIAQSGDERQQRAGELYQALFDKIRPRVEENHLIWTFDGAWLRSVKPIFIEMYRLSQPVEEPAPESPDSTSMGLNSTIPAEQPFQPALNIGSGQK